MTGPEHYREAELLLDLTALPVPNSELGWMARAQAAAEAQVHATLALTAATADAYAADRDYSLWLEVLR